MGTQQATERLKKELEESAVSTKTRTPKIGGIRRFFRTPMGRFLRRLFGGVALPAATFGISVAISGGLGKFLDLFATSALGWVGIIFVGLAAVYFGQRMFSYSPQKVSLTEADLVGLGYPVEAEEVGEDAFYSTSSEPVFEDNIQDREDQQDADSSVRDSLELVSGKDSPIYGLKQKDIDPSITANVEIPVSSMSDRHVQATEQVHQSQGSTSKLSSTESDASLLRRSGTTFGSFSKGGKAGYQKLPEKESEEADDQTEKEKPPKPLEPL